MRARGVPPCRRPYLMPGGFLCLWAVFAAGLTCSVSRQSQTWDEANHIFAGYRYWKTADFGINPEHPPLLKLWASLPLLDLPLQDHPLHEVYFKDVGWMGGRDLLYSNNADQVLFRARLASGLFALLLAALVFEAAYAMFGVGPAFIALALLVFEPNILAHGALVTTDMAITCLLFASVYAFYRYAKRPSGLRLFESGLTAGLALAAKHSGIIVFPVLGLLGLAEAMGRKRITLDGDSQVRERGGRWGRHAIRTGFPLLAITVIAVAVLWGFYGFRYQARPGGAKMNPSLSDYVRYVKNPAVSRIILKLQDWRLLPESYVYGLADVVRANAGRRAFILGRLYPRGRWFYFPAAFLIKSTLGFLAILVLALAARRARPTEKRMEILFLVIPALLYLLVSMTSRLNIGIRHLLPIYPFLLVLSGVGAGTLIKQRRSWAYVVGVLTALHALSSLASFPHYLAYSNEICGGTRNTYRLLSDSDVDWGQGLKYAERYLEQRRITDCWLAYNGTADPLYYRVSCKLLPGFRGTEIIPEIVEGTVLVSATYTSGLLSGPAELNPFSDFARARPDDNIGGSILVFHGRFDLRLASAMGHLNKAWQLESSNQSDQALAEARIGVSLAPHLTESHFVLGFVLAQRKQVTEARREFETALDLARRIHPEFREEWIPFLEQKLSSL